MGRASRFPPYRVRRPPPHGIQHGPRQGPRPEVEGAPSRSRDELDPVGGLHDKVIVPRRVGCGDGDPLKVHLGPLVDFGELNDKAIKGLMCLSKIVSMLYLHIHKQLLKYLFMDE
jgi:hypothetical protein